MFDLTEGRVGKTLTTMTMFTTMGMVSILGFALADAYYVGLLGKNYLASISYCVPILLFTSGIGVGIGIGAEAILARLVGEGQDERSKEFATIAMSFATAVSILFGLMGYAIIDEIPVWLETDPALYPLMQQYLVIWFVGIPPLVVCLVAGSLARALGDAQTPAIVMVVTSLMNALLDPILIFGIDGWVPAMGFEGAAWATLFSRAVAGVWSVYLLVFRYHLLSDRIPTLAYFWSDSKEICRLGFPATMVQLIFPMGQACLLKLLAVFPVAVVAAFGMAMQVEAFGFIILMSLGIILGPFVGQNVGANSTSRVLRSVDLSLAFNLFNGTALAVVFWVFGEPILSCFHDDPEVVDNMVMIMHWLSLSWVLEGVRILAAPVFTNLGSSVPPMVIVTIRFFVIALPLAWWLREFWGFDGVVFSLALGNVVAGIISYVWLKKALPTAPHQ
jgi:putative MATE family efflux protein